MEWISVKDKKPREMVPVRIRTARYAAGDIVAYLDHGEWREGHSGEGKRIVHPEDITHWAPIKHE